jgi:hypothetical protein
MGIAAGGRAFSEAKAAGGQTMKRIMMASALLGSVVLGAPAFANDTYSGTDTTGSSTSMTNPHAVHKKLMKDCMDQQKAQGGSSASDARKTCESKVKDQMQQMNDAGTIPPSSVPGKQQPGSSNATGNAGSNGS